MDHLKNLDCEVPGLAVIELQIEEVSIRYVHCFDISATFAGTTASKSSSRAWASSGVVMVVALMKYSGAESGGTGTRALRRK